MPSEQDYRHRVEEAIKRSGARYCEVRLEETTGTSVVYRGKRLDAATEVLDRGGFVRCLAENGGWGTATFNDPDQLGRKVQEALDCARAIPSERVEIAEVEAQVVVQRAQLEQDFREVPLLLPLLADFHAVLQLLADFDAPLVLRPLLLADFCCSVVGSRRRVLLSKREPKI